MSFSNLRPLLIVHAKIKISKNFFDIKAIGLKEAKQIHCRWRVIGSGSEFLGTLIFQMLSVCLQNGGGKSMRTCK